jgi:hypothetical protein
MSTMALDIHEKKIHLVLCKVNFIMDQNKNCPATVNKAHHNATHCPEKRKICSKPLGAILRHS